MAQKLGGFHIDFMGSELRPVFDINSRIGESSSNNSIGGDLVVKGIQLKCEDLPPKYEDLPPKYEYIESPEITTLFLLKPYQKLRRINNTIAVETRNRIMRTFSQDSREQTYQDIKRILENSKTQEERTKITTGINVLITTTYKNDKKWVQKVLDLINFPK